jgi:hypothetical protein
VLPGRANRPAFTDADRGPDLDYKLRLRGYHSQGKAEQCSKNQFSHSLLLRLYEQMHGRSGKAEHKLFRAEILKPQELGPENAKKPRHHRNRRSARHETKKAYLLFDGDKEV